MPSIIAGQNERDFIIFKLFFRLDAGWSLKTANMNAWTKQPDPMTTEEHQKILEVIEKAEALERAEQERVGQVKYGLDIFFVLFLNI